MSKHTAGPWTLNITGSDKSIHNIDQASTGKGIAVPLIDNSANGGGRAEYEANARLIAAAPELLEAVQKLLPLVARGLTEGAYERIVSGPEYAQRVLTMVDALIEKTTGGAK